MKQSTKPITHSSGLTAHSSQLAASFPPYLCKNKTCLLNHQNRLSGLKTACYKLSQAHYNLRTAGTFYVRPVQFAYGFYILRNGPVQFLRTADTFCGTGHTIYPITTDTFCGMVQYNLRYDWYILRYRSYNLRYGWYILRYRSPQFSVRLIHFAVQ